MKVKFCALDLLVNDMSTFPVNVSSIPKEQSRIREKCFHPSGAFEEFKKEDIDQSIPGRFEQQVQLYPDRLAVKAKEEVLAGIEGDGQAADPAPSEETVLPPPPKTIIQFGHNSMRISEEANEKLDQIVRYSSSYPGSKIIVEGYTDRLGHPLYNKNLSRMRAEVIKKALVGKGLPETKIEAIGRGPENPIASNETFEGRKQNRRIEIRFQAQ